MPNSSVNPLIYDGAIHGDSRRIINGTFEQCLIANTTVVTATNPTSAANLMTGVIPGGTLNRIGQTLQVWGAGLVNLTTSTSAVTFTVILGGITIATFTTGNFAIGAINLSWNLNLQSTVVTIDSGGNVTLEPHGQVSGSLTTLAGAVTSYNDSAVAASSSIAAATAQTLQIQALLAAGNAASFVNQRQLIVDLYN